MHSGKPELRLHQNSFLPQTSLVLSAAGSLELRLVSSAILEHTNNNTSHSFLGLVIVSNDRRTDLQYWYVECTHLNRLDEAILMSKHKIQFHNKINKLPQLFVFLSYRKNFLRTENVFELAMVNELSVFEL